MAARKKKTKKKSKRQLSKAAAIRLLLRRMKFKSEFPALPANIAELNTCLASDPMSAVVLANVVLKDHAITTKLLKLSNSPVFGIASGRIKTVSHAVVMLGFDAVRQIALSLMLFEQFNAV